MALEKRLSGLHQILVGCGCLIILLGLIFAVVIGGVGGYFGFEFYKWLKKPAKVVSDHLDAAGKGNYRKAYDYFFYSLKEDLPYSEFVQLVKAKPYIYQSKSYNFDSIRIKNKVATISGTITGKDGTVTPVVFKLLYTKGEWKIYFFDFSRRGVQEKPKKEVLNPTFMSQSTKNLAISSFT